jgi:excisionase family DNA binding protein
MTQTEKPQPEILTPKNVAALLCVPLSWVYAKTRKRQRQPLPCHRIGKYLRFTKAEVLAWYGAQ